MFKIISVFFIFVVNYFMYCAIFGLFFSFLNWDISIFLEAITIFKKIDGMSVGLMRSVGASFALMSVVFYLADKGD